MNRPPTYYNRKEKKKIAKTVRTLYDYEPHHDDDLGFGEGEILEILEFKGDNYCNSDDWLLARSVRNGKIGYVPKNYIIDDVSRVKSTGRCSDENTEEVEEISTTPGNSEETFLTDCSTAKFARALYDYEARHENDLGFREGERMTVVDSKENREMGEWLWAVHLENGKSGYVPKNYVVIEDNAESQEWWLDVDRKEAEKILKSSTNTTGTFLIRKSTEGNEFALSVLDRKESSSGAVVRHYRIRNDDEAGSLYITQKRSFRDLCELVEHYRQSGDGLCCILTNACPRVSSTI